MLTQKHRSRSVKQSQGKNRIQYSRTIRIGERVDYKSKDTDQQLLPIPVTIELIPLRLVSKKFLELPDMMTQIINFTDRLDRAPDLIQNLIEGKLWKEKRKLFCDKTVLLLVLLLFHTLNKADLGFDGILIKALNELKFLETEGIDVLCAGNATRVFFSLATVIGDNLGGNEAMGFMESFTANYSCRFCLTPREEINSVFDEEFCTSRTPQNYDEHVRVEEPTKTGIRIPCIFNSL